MAVAASKSYWCIVGSWLRPRSGTERPGDLLSILAAHVEELVCACSRFICVPFSWPSKKLHQGAWHDLQGVPSWPPAA